MKFIAVSGYGWSGSSAVVDLLREYEDYKFNQNEFRILKDPHGILDLESSLVDNWDIIRSDVAIIDFLKYCSILNRKGSKYYQRGYDFSTTFKIDFMSLAIEYINSISLMTYKGNSLVFDYPLSKYSFFIKRLKKKILGQDYQRLMFLAKPTKEEFVQATVTFLESIFKNYAQKNETVILDQVISVSTVEQSLKYFKDIKIILIDRDPRDICVELVKEKAFIGPEIINTNNIDKFINWFKITRACNKHNCAENVMKIRFEDLVLNYHDTVYKIEQFTNNKAQHTNALKFFDPTISIKNIGIWKSFHNQDMMTKIRENLPEFCFEGND
jgi:hypothetical protein